MNTARQLKTREIIEKVKNKLNIDLEQYKNTDAFSKVFQIFMIQNYAIGKMIRPVIIALLIFVGGFFILELHGYQYVLYSVFGFLFLIIIAIQFGIIRMLNSLKNDLKLIINQVVALFQYVLNDLSNLKDNAQSKLDNKETIGLIFEGLINGLVTPNITIKTDGILVAGKYLSKGVDLTMASLISQFKKQEYAINYDLNSKSQNTFGILNNIKATSEKYLKSAEKSINLTLNTIQFPFKLGMAFSSIMFVLFILIIN